MKNENKFSLPTRFGLVSLGGFGIYSIIGLHFLLAVRTAHFLGDAAYIPPSILRFTGVIYTNSEVSAFAEIVFLVIWLAFIGFTCWAMFRAGVFVKDSLGSLFFDTNDERAEYAKCFTTAFYALLPVLILSLLTLAMTPVQSHKYDTASMSEIAEAVSFPDFLTAMDEGTIALFGVTLFVVLIMTVVLLLMKILPDNVPMMFVALFIGVIVGVAVMMPLMWFGAKGFEFINLKMKSSYLSHFVLFAIYSIASAVFILPTLNRKKKITGKKLPA